MKRWIAALLALVLAACLAWAIPAAAESGKDGAKQPAPEKASDVAEDADEQEEEEDLDGLPRLGEETDTCATVKLTNAAGADIVALCLKRSEDWAWSDSLLEEDAVLPAEESAVLCFEPSEEDEEDASYELLVTLADEDGETMAVCHALALTDMEDAQIMRAWNGVLYVAYTSLETGEETDTAEAEQALAGTGGEQGADGSEGCIGSAGLLN